MNVFLISHESVTVVLQTNATSTTTTKRAIAITVTSTGTIRNITTAYIPTPSDAPSGNDTSSDVVPTAESQHLSSTIIGVIIGVSVGAIVIIIGLILFFVCMKR